MSKPKQNSRWKAGGTIPRYDERTLSGILTRYREGDGWRNGAKVRKP